MSDFTDKVMDLGETALHKAADLVDTGTAKVDIMKLKSKIKDEQEKIGAHVAANRDKYGEDPELAGFFSEIDALQKQIDDINAQLESK